MPAVNASVTAIVLNWCNEGETAACLESLAASTHAPLTILLVDNGSPDGSGDRLHERFPALPYLQTGQNYGYAGGMNRGIQWALAHGADFVLILNDDTVVDPECIRGLVRAIDESGAAVSVPQILYFDDPQRVWYAGGRISRTRALGVHLRENRPSDPGQTRAPISFVCGCCFLIRADVARVTGGFDESFFAYVEDVELSVRLSRAGYHMVYEPSARVLHRVGMATEPTPFQIRQRDRNRRRLVAKHYPWPERARFALWFYPSRAVLLARYLAKRDVARATATVQGAVR